MTSTPCECQTTIISPEDRANAIQGHHPRCKRPIPMVKIEVDGQFCIFPDLDRALEEARLHFTEGDHGSSFTWTNVRMSAAEYSLLPEFTGW